MGGGAHDLVVEQASQPPYALGKEGRELAVACSACLRSHLAQLGSFRIESKVESTKRTGPSATPAPFQPLTQRGFLAALPFTRPRPRYSPDGRSCRRALPVSARQEP